MRAETSPTHWLLPVDPRTHRDGLPPDWRTDPEATAVWQGIGRTQDVTRWCLRSGYRSMRVGDRIWIYLSGRQELCAVGTTRAVEGEGPDSVVVVDWDEARTTRLCRDPLPRTAFGQIPMSTCRARLDVALLLTRTYELLGVAQR